MEQCLCGDTFPGPQKLFTHRRGCPVIADKMRSTYAELMAAGDTPAVTHRNWDAARDPALPSANTLLGWYESWAHFQAAMAGGEAVLHGRYYEYIPPAPAGWDKLLPAGKFVGDGVESDLLYNFLTAMVLVARKEAEGGVSHWCNQVSPAEQAALQADASEWLSELRASRRPLIFAGGGMSATRKIAA